MTGQGRSECKLVVVIFLHEKRGSILDFLILVFNPVVCIVLTPRIPSLHHPRLLLIVITNHQNARTRSNKMRGNQFFVLLFSLGSPFS